MSGLLNSDENRGAGLRPCGWLSSRPWPTTLLLALIPTILQATPTLSTPTITPATVAANQPTQITATCQLTTTAGDPTLLPNGMNLVRLTAAEAVATILGAMTPGANGTYSYTFTDTETATGQYQRSPKISPCTPANLERCPCTIGNSLSWCRMIDTSRHPDRACTS